MNDFLIATKNKNKLEEFREILEPLSINVLSYNDFDVELSIEETGKTYEENSLIKALGAYNEFNYPVIADDSGLEIDFLDGKPGIHTARYCGANLSDRERYEKILVELKNVPLEKRNAKFICAISVVFSKENYFTIRGEVEGLIAFKPAGENGFGYDPIFYLPDYNKTMAELEPEQKHLISHRGIALKKMISRLRKI